jgi:hypothetical protein
MQDQYFTSKKVNQSSLKLILVHPMMYKNSMEYSEDRKDTPALSLGSLVDCLITEPEKFSTTYHVQNEAVTTSSAIQKIVMSVYLDTRGNTIEADRLIDYKDLLLETVRKSGYQPKWKDETVITNVCNEGEKYFEELKIQGDKIAVTQDQYLLAKEIVDSILSHDYTKDHLFPNGNIEIVKQLVIDWEHRGFECKSKLDWLVVNHDDKTIQPIDIKTTESLLSKWFDSSYHKYRYDMQAGYYTMAVKYKQQNENWYSDYTVLPFKFIVENTKYPGTPVCFVINTEELYAYKAYEVNGVTYEGIKEAFDRLEWHTDNDLWGYTKEHFEQNGLVGL